MAGKSMLQNSVAKLGARVGYARVSTEEQSLDIQLAALREAGCVKTFQEKESGARSDRPALAEVMAFLREGDTLVVTRFDRLARSLDDLLATLKAVASKGAAFQCLANPSLNVDNSANGQLMLHVFAAVAQFERTLLLERCEGGRRSAMAKGVRFGRKLKLNGYQRQEALTRLASGESVRSIARSYGVHYSMVSRLGRSALEGPAIAISESPVRSAQGAATPLPGDGSDASAGF